jgi:hypothetical protein
MATSFAPLLLQAMDDYGDVLAGGKIYTYEAGTTTDLATYQDLLGVTPNTNPVVLNAAGRATVRVTNGVAYKFVLTDANDEIIATYDNIVIGTASETSGQSYLVHMTFQGTPGAQGFMGGHIFTDDVLFPIDFEGADGAVQSNPGADYIISVRKNDVEVGTAVIGTGGDYTFATTSHVTVAYAVGDKLTFIAPDGVGVAADFSLVLEGEVQ